MNKLEAKKIRELLNKTLEPVLKEQGYTIEIGNAGYSNDEIKFNNIIIAEQGVMPKAERDLLDQITFLTEIKNKKLLKKDTVTTIDGVEYTLTGYRPRASKRPYIIIDNKNNEYVITEKEALQHFGYDNLESPDYVEKGTPLHDLRV